jgi:hypothetical protein
VKFIINKPLGSIVDMDIYCFMKTNKLYICVMAVNFYRQMLAHAPWISSEVGDFKIDEVSTNVSSSKLDEHVTYY